MEQDIRHLIREELKLIFEARKKTPSYTVVDGNDCLPKNEVTPYQVLKRSESKCQNELSYIGVGLLQMADILVKTEYPAEERIAATLELVYKFM